MELLFILATNNLIRKLGATPTFSFFLPTTSNSCSREVPIVMSVTLAAGVDMLAAGWVVEEPLGTLTVVYQCAARDQASAGTGTGTSGFGHR